MPDLEPVYLIGGSDRPKVDVAITRLRGHFEAGSVDRFDAAVVDAGTVVAACNAGTLFGDSRLVIVDQVDGRPGDDRRLRTTWKVAEVEIVVDYLRSPAPGTVLCLVSTEVKKDAALVKAVSKAGSVLAFEIDKRKTVGWVAERFRVQRVRVDPEAAALLVALVGDTDKHMLAQEVDKVVTWASSDPDVTVGEREILDLVVPEGETPPWEVTDAWAAHDPAKALRAVERIFDKAGASQRRKDEAARVASTLGFHLGKLRRAGVAAASGERPSEHAKRTKQSSYPVEKLYKQVEEMSTTELDDATTTLAHLDRALKGGSRLSAELELERAVTALSRDRARHA